MIEMEKEIKNCLVRIKLNDGTKINGQVNINGFDRLSDLMLDKQQSFLILVNAVIYMDNMERPVKQKVVFVNKKYIVWATPDNG